MLKTDAESDVLVGVALPKGGVVVAADLQLLATAASDGAVNSMTYCSISPCQDEPSASKQSPHRTGACDAVDEARAVLRSVPVHQADRLLFGKVCRHVMT